MLSLPRARRDDVCGASLFCSPDVPTLGPGADALSLTGNPPSESPVSSSADEPGSPSRAFADCHADRAPEGEPISSHSWSLPPFAPRDTFPYRSSPASPLLLSDLLS